MPSLPPRTRQCHECRRSLAENRAIDFPDTRGLLQPMSVVMISKKTRAGRTCGLKLVDQARLSVASQPWKVTRSCSRPPARRRQPDSSTYAGRRRALAPSGTPTTVNADRPTRSRAAHPRAAAERETIGTVDVKRGYEFDAGPELSAKYRMTSVREAIGMHRIPAAPHSAPFSKSTRSSRRPEARACRTEICFLRYRLGARPYRTRTSKPDLAENSNSTERSPAAPSRSSKSPEDTVRRRRTSSRNSSVAEEWTATSLFSRPAETMPSPIAMPNGAHHSPRALRWCRRRPGPGRGGEELASCHSCSPPWVISIWLILQETD